MRVLNVVTNLNHGGGIEMFLMHFFRAVQDRDDLEIDLCYLQDEPGTLIPEAEALGITTWRSMWVPEWWRTQQLFTKALERRPAYDVIHAHIGNQSGPYLAVAAQKGVPRRIANYHNITPGHRNDMPRRLYERMVRRMVLQHATQIAGCSWAAIRAYYSDVWGKEPRLSVLRYGLPLKDFTSTESRADVRREFGVPADAPLIGHVGRFVWQKNHKGLLRAARKVLDQRPEFHFLLVGDGDIRQECETYARELGVTKNVIFAGRRTDVPRLLPALDLFVLPSIAEGFGITLIEAQLFGLPCVGAALPAMKEAISREFQSYLRDPEDAEGLAESCINLYDETQRNPSLREAARTFAKKYSMENSVQGMLAAWGVPGVEPPEELTPWAAPPNV